MPDKRRNQDGDPRTSRYELARGAGCLVAACQRSVPSGSGLEKSNISVPPIFREKRGWTRFTAPISSICLQRLHELSDRGLRIPDFPARPSEGARSHDGARLAQVRVLEAGTTGGAIKVQLSVQANGQERFCEEPACQALALVPLGWSSDDTELYFATTSGSGCSGIFSWDLAAGGVRPLFETEGVIGARAAPGRYRSGHCPISDGYFICTFSSPDTPPRLLSISSRTGKTELVWDPNAELRSKLAARTEKILWTDRYGREVAGTLVLPPENDPEKRYPLVITNYRCGGFLMGGSADCAPEYMLAQSGIVALCIDYNDASPDTVDLPSGYLGPARYELAVAEYQGAIDLLDRRGLIDRQRVGITGFSFGSQAATYTLMKSDMFLTAALRGFAVIEAEHFQFFRPDNLKTPGYMSVNNLTGDPVADERVMGQMSVSRNARKISAPVLVQASDGEYLASLPAFASVQKAGGMIEMFVFPDEGHMLFQPAHRDSNYRRNLDWLRFWLQGHEDPDARKADDYHRWRDMRVRGCQRQVAGIDPPAYCADVSR